jgi:hypothetical protein
MSMNRVFRRFGRILRILGVVLAIVTLGNTRKGVVRDDIKERDKALCHVDRRKAHIGFH